MADRQVTLHDRDVIVYTTGDEAARKAAFRRVFDMAERVTAAVDQEVVDRDSGEIRPRQYRLIWGEDVDPKTVKQRNFLHGVALTQLAERFVFPGGRQFDLQTWKEMMRAKFLGDEWVVEHRIVVDQETGELRPSKRATPTRRRISTESLSVRHYSDYIDKVIHYITTELGIELDLDPIERENVRYKAPKRRKKEPE